MAYDFRVGTLDLAAFLNVQPDSGLDPFDSGFREPQFSESPAVEGGVKVLDQQGLKELVWPLALQPRPYSFVATNAMQEPGLETGTYGVHWSAGDNAWTGAARDVTSDWADPVLGGDYSMHWSGTIGNMSPRAPQVGVANATYMTVLNVGGNTRAYAAVTFAGPSAPELLSLRLRSVSSGGASNIQNDVLATVGASEIAAAWRAGRQGVRLEGIGTAHPSAKFLDAHLLVTPQGGPGAVATYDQLDLYGDNAVFVQLRRADNPTTSMPDGRLDYFDGDHLDAYWSGERGNSYSLTRQGKQGLLEMQRKLSAELQKADGGAGLRLRFRDEGASQVSYFDVVDGRMEPGYHYFKWLNNWGDHALRIWAQPYAHTATERIVATGVASRVVNVVSLPTTLQGDVPALLDVRITAGNTIPSVGRRVAFSVLPHPSYAVDFEAASIGDRQTGATLVGLSGAHASQYLALPVSPTGASGVAAMVQLPIPTVYAGRNRVFALARSGLNTGVAMRIFDQFGNALGPTAMATVQESFGLLDMGILTLPAGQIPTTYKLPIVAGGASGYSVTATPGLHLNAVFVLPEDTTTVVNDVAAAASTLAGDDFDGPGGNLTGQADDYGNTWAVGRSRATTTLFEGVGYVSPNNATPCGNYIDLPIQDCETTLRFDLGVAVASGHQLAVRRDVSASYYIDANYQHRPSRALSLISVASGATTLHASQALASVALGALHTLTLRTLGGQAIVNLRRADAATMFLAGPSGVTVASIGASHANLQQNGNPGLFGYSAETEEPHFYSVAVTSIPSSQLVARDIYRFTVDDQITRAPSGLDITAHLEGQARNVAPNAPAPTTTRVAALIAPVDQGAGNDLNGLELRARERFTFLR